MLLSPLAVLKTLSAQPLRQWGRHLLGVAAQRHDTTPQPPLSLSPPPPRGYIIDTQSSCYSCTSEALQHRQQCSSVMTTSQHQRRQLAPVQHAHPGAGLAVTHSSKKSRQGNAVAAAVMHSSEPCCSSIGSGSVTALERPPSRAGSPATASTKSAKRKAAEALLAAQYGGLGAGKAASSTAAAPGSILQAAYMSDVAAAGHADVQLSKRARHNTLSTAINRLGGGAQAAPPAPQDGAAAAGGAADAERTAAADRVQASTAVQRKQLQAMLQAQQQQQQPQRPGEVAASSWQLSDHTAVQDAAAVHLPSDDSVAGEGADTAAPVSNNKAHASTGRVEAAGAAQVQQQQQQGVHPQPQQQSSSSVVVPACGPDCAHVLSQGWCHSQVQLPHLDWSRVLDADMARIPSFKIAQGYERMQMPGGIQVLLVENHVHLTAALTQLRSSMQDSVVAIDLEWRPEFGRGFTPVAMVQLASSKVAVLIRTCLMGYRLPPVLKDFLKDSKVHLLGFSWAGQDEGKMQSTFGVGSRDFGRFLDLQQVAQGLGYYGYGLARLTRQVLGLHMPKSKKISTSNWEIRSLSRTQVKYAALDVLVAGQVFRALRLWHSSPSLCEVCHYNLGAVSSQQTFLCSTCDKAYWDIKGYLQHCERYEHAPSWAECEGCGCARALPWPSSKAAAAAAAAAAQQPPSSQQSS